MFYTADLQSQIVRNDPVAEEVREREKTKGKYGKTMRPSWDQENTVKTEIRFTFSKKFKFLLNTSKYLEGYW